MSLKTWLYDKLLGDLCPNCGAKNWRVCWSHYRTESGTEVWARKPHGRKCRSCDHYQPDSDAPGQK